MASVLQISKNFHFFLENYLKLRYFVSLKLLFRDKIGITEPSFLLGGVSVGTLPEPVPTYVRYLS